MNLEELKERNRQTFSQESEDLLQDLDDALLHLEASPDNLDLVNRVFRSMHTLKGSGATVGFKDLADFLHHVEDAFNAVREGKIPVTSELVDVALKSCDIVRAYLAGKDEQECAENLKPAAAIVEQVKRLKLGTDADRRRRERTGEHAGSARKIIGSGDRLVVVVGIGVPGGGECGEVAARDVDEPLADLERRRGVEA